MKVNPDPLAEVRHRTFTTWEVLGRTQSDGKGARVLVRCRQCGFSQPMRKRNLLTGYYQFCTKCYGTESPIARHMPPDDYDPTSTNHTKETHA